MRERGIEADFRATGQTGIMIAGGGIPMDAVVSDFAAGAAEMLSPAAPDDHWDVIEGQGSLLHPAFAGVSLALLHGSQPDVFVVCHDPTRDAAARRRGLRDAERRGDHRPDDPPRLAHQSRDPRSAASASIPRRSVRTRRGELMAREGERLGLPVADPMRGGDRVRKAGGCMRRLILARAGVRAWSAHARGSRPSRRRRCRPSLAASAARPTAWSALPPGGSTHRGPRILVNADQPFPMASTFKVAVAGTILSQVDRGQAVARPAGPGDSRHDGRIRRARRDLPP